MRPITKPGTPGGWPPKDALTFAGANATALDACMGDHTNLPLANCLNLWLSQVKKTVVPQPCASLRATGVNAIQNQVGGLYKQASVPLTQALGAFCSFCGSPLSGLLEVEHGVPKANYPTYSVSWKNFLLACSPCNNAKGNTPSRATAGAWIGTADPTEAQYYAEIRGNHYVWPDLDDRCYRYLPVSLQGLNVSTNQWVTLPFSHAGNINNVLISSNIATRKVIARIYAPDNVTHEDMHVQVIVDAVNPQGTTDATEMVKLCGFNDVVNTQSTYDRRMLNRTKAWFTCLAALQRFSQASTPEAQQLLWDALVQHAGASGFYSVWLFLIDSHHTGLGEKFIADTNVPGLFPGTDTTNLP